MTNNKTQMSSQEIKAKLRHLHISPRKVRLVADLVRGMDVEEALNQLRFVKKKAALPIAKLIKSAIANAEHNFKLKKENLYIKRIFVDQGPTMKRTNPRAMGRADIIRKRSSHVSLILDKKKTEESQKSQKSKYKKQK